MYPAGWRSFAQTLISLNLFEVISEIVGLSAIEGTLTNEYIALNKILAETVHSITEIIGLNEIESISEAISEIIGLNEIESISELISEIIGLNEIESISEAISEIIGLNVIESVELINEIIGLNLLANEYTPEIIGKNIIQLRNFYRNEYIGINRLDPIPNYEKKNYDISIFIDETLVTGHIVDWKIDISGDNYTNTASLTFADENFFSLCDPLINLGEKRIKIIIDEISYEFLLEKQSPSISPTDKSFSVWGRSKISTLDLPYIAPITDKEIVQDPTTLEWSCPEDPTYVPHFWQTADRTASSVIENLAGTFSVSFLIDEFIVKKDEFVASGETPIELINKLAKVVGAHVRTDLDDNVVIKYYQFNTTGTADISFTDLENIFVLNENIELPEGYNRVLVRGRKDPMSEQNASLEIILDEVRNEEKTIFLFTEDIWLKVYRSPFDINYYYTTSLGEILLVTESIVETIEREESGFTDRTLQTQFPINAITSIERYDCTEVSTDDYTYEQGYKTIVSSEDSDIENEPVLISYTTKYDLYKLNVNQPCDPLIFEEVLSRITVTQT